MKIRLLNHQDIDREKWDHVINSSPDGLIYACSWYLDLAAPGWCALATDNYSYLMPLPVRKKWNLKYVYPPFFIQQLGIFGRQLPVEPMVVDSFLNELITHFRFVQLYFHEQCPVIPYPYCRWDKRINYILPLNQSYDTIRRQYSPQLKRNLKKAEKSGAVIQSLTEVEPVIRLFRRSQAGRRAAYRPADYRIFAALVQAGDRQGMVHMTGAYDVGGNLQAAAVFFHHRQRIIFIFSGATPYGRKHSYLALLLDDVIRRYSCRSVIFDFEGSMDTGLAQFYKSFGSQATSYHLLTMNRLPTVVQWIKKLKTEIL
jgi:hypothetical protein